jgi:hypothetical protein
MLHSRVGSQCHVVDVLQVVAEPEAAPVARKLLTQAVTGSSGRPGCPKGYIAMYRSMNSPQASGSAPLAWKVRSVR